MTTAYQFYLSKHLRIHTGNTYHKVQWPMLAVAPPIFGRVSPPKMAYLSAFLNETTTNQCHISIGIRTRQPNHHTPRVTKHFHSDRPICVESIGFCDPLHRHRSGWTSGGTHGERRRWVRAEWGEVWGGVSPLQPTK